MSTRTGSTFSRWTTVRCAVFAGVVAGMLVAAPSVASARTADDGSAAWQRLAPPSTPIEQVLDAVRADVSAVHGFMDGLLARPVREGRVSRIPTPNCEPVSVVPINLPLPEPGMREDVTFHMTFEDDAVPMPVDPERGISRIETPAPEPGFVTPINIPLPQPGEFEGTGLPPEAEPVIVDVVPINIPLP